MVTMKTPKYSGGGSVASKVARLDLLELNGGLNLGSSPVQLGASESPNALNVDFPAYGGVSRRKAIASISIPVAPPSGITGGGAILDGQLAVDNLATTKGTFTGLFTLEQATAGVQILYGLKSGTNSLLFESTSALVRDTIPSLALVGASMNSNLYIAAGPTVTTRRWNGVASTVMTESFYDDPETLPHGAFPRCGCVAVHKGSMFAANLNNDPSGIRWSWPNQPEDWPTWAVESIDAGERKDEIVALVPQGERLLVFKRNSIHAVYGDGPRDFRLVPLSKTTGAAGPNAVCKTDTSDVYFYDHPNGLFRIGPSGGPERTSFDQIVTGMPPVVADPSAAVVRFANRKLYVSLPWASATRNSRTFVKNMAGGGWAAHDYGLGGLVQIIPDAAADYSMAIVIHPDEPVARLGVPDSIGDVDFGIWPIVGTWQSAWFSAGDLMQEKRWRKVGLVMSGSALVRLTGRLDYSKTDGSAVFIQPPTSNQPQWGTATWGAFNWSTPVDTVTPRTALARQSGVGKALSVLIANDNIGDWHVSALQITFIPKRRRD